MDRTTALALLLAAVAVAGAVPAAAGPVVESVTEPTEQESVTLEHFVQQVKGQLEVLQKKKIIVDGSDAEVGKLIALLDKLSADEQKTRGVECNDQKCAEHCKTRPGFNTGYCNHYRLCSCYYSPYVTPAPPTDCPR